MGNPTKKLPMIERDGWLLPVEKELTARHESYLRALREIEKSAGSIVDYANGYRYFGWQRDEALEGWWFREWLPGAQDVYLLGDFNSEADVRGEGYDLVLGSGWQDTYRLAQQRAAGYTVVEAIDGWRDAPDAAAKKRIDQIWCSKAVAVKSSRVVFNGLQEPQVSDHAGVMIEL